MGASAGTGIVVLSVILCLACCVGIAAACARCSLVSWVLELQAHANNSIELRSTKPEESCDLELGQPVPQSRARRVEAVADSNGWLNIPGTQPGAGVSAGVFHRQSGHLRGKDSIDGDQESLLTSRELRAAPDAAILFQRSSEEFDRRGRDIYGDAWDTPQPGTTGAVPGLPLKAVFSLRPQVSQDLQARARAQARALASEKRARGRRMPLASGMQSIELQCDATRHGVSMESISTVGKSAHDERINQSKSAAAAAAAAAVGDGQAQGRGATRTLLGRPSTEREIEVKSGYDADRYSESESELESESDSDDAGAMDCEIQAKWRHVESNTYGGDQHVP